MYLHAKGKYIESVVQFSQAPGEDELDAAKFADQVKSPADLKGKTLGVTGLGSSTDFLTQYLVSRNGLKPGEFALLGVGAGNTFIAAMKQGQIAAGMTTEPTRSEEHTSELQSLMRISYAVFCLKKKKTPITA